jgi:tetratricopeptide (TPR) repeat protein
LGTAKSLAAAEKSASQAIELDDHRAMPHAVRGQARLLLGQTEKSLEDFERALKLSQGNFLAAAGRVRALAKLDQLDKALAASQESLANITDVRWQAAELHLLEHALYKRLGQDKSAETALQEARKLDESLTDERVRKFLNRFP